MDSQANEVLRILIEARDLIADPARWTQGMNARTAQGRRCEALSSEATCWCAVGALARVVESLSLPALFVPACEALMRYGKIRSRVFAYNDRHTHQEVLDLFDRAIAACSKE